MKGKWKYGRNSARSKRQGARSPYSLREQQAIGNWSGKTSGAIANYLLSIVNCLLFIACFSACHVKDEHKHINSGKSGTLDGLEQPTNQTVFSEIKTISPIQQSITPVLNATGLISYDPRLINNISARFSGRIEKLYPRFNFENISKGQRIMDIYSPDILTSQQNLIDLLKNNEPDVLLINSTKRKLQLFGLSDAQIKQIEKTKQLINPLPVYSPYSGHIHDIGITGNQNAPSAMNTGVNSGMNSNASSTSQVQIENIPSAQSSALTIKEGMYVESGQPVFAIYNIDQVWAVINIFPNDAALIKTGDPVSIITESNPTKTIYAHINYIEPVTGQKTFAIKARVYLKNEENLHLKIGTLLSAKITTTQINGWWLPRSAVISLGQNDIVFLKTKNRFITKSIRSGYLSDSLIQIISGLQNDEQVAYNAQFMIDSESFIKIQ